MNYVIFFTILNLILISRLCFTLRDDGITTIRDLTWLTIIPLLILPFLSVNPGWILLAIYLLILRPFLTSLMERTENKLNRNRIIMLAVNILAIGILCGPLFNLNQPDWMTGLENSLLKTFLPDRAGSLHWLTFHSALFGFLMTLNESNIAIRFTLEKLKLAPLSNSHHEIDEQQYKTGRVIGFLERIFVFLFILLNQYTAIGFIIAAKGIVRYPDFGEKSFNEYILIGTLLSVLFAMLVASITMLFIQ